MKKYVSKIIIAFLFVIMVLPFATVDANILPSISVSAPSKSEVYEGGSLSYTVVYSYADEIYLSASHVNLHGFSANISISGSGNTRVINLSNIKGSAGTKSISIDSSTASNSAAYVGGVSKTISFNLAVKEETNIDKVRPSISISEPNFKKVNAGGSLTYTVTFADNVLVKNINLTSSHVVLNGFTAKISIAGKGSSRMITLSNIQGTAGNKTIKIKAGVASDAAGNTTLVTSNSVAFALVKKQSGVSKNPTTNNSGSNKANTSNSNKVTFVKSNPTVKNTCENDLKVLGDINKNIKGFSTWFSSYKDNAKYAIQNNYVAKGEIVTYFVDYYNGKNDKVNNAKITLTIPYNVDVQEINGGGNIKSQTATATQIEWNKKDIETGGRCRLTVKVKYLENAALTKSKNLSETFYVNAKTICDGKETVSNLRQLYIDTNSNKTASVNRYLTSLDNSNYIRPDDKITRAELAKLLVDSGVVKTKSGNTDYKKYKDASEVPTYAQAAVSAIYSTGIIDTLYNSEFKPNNPIVRDEFFKIVAKSAEYMSQGKIKTQESPFIYTDILDDDDKTISDNKTYIMELVRQNVIKKADTNPDEYILRKDAVEIINALTFRGPYVEKVQPKSITFVDVKNESKYFYNILGASNSYTYNYTEDLLQQIKEIK